MSSRKHEYSAISSLPIPAHCAPWPVKTNTGLRQALALLTGDTCKSPVPSVTQYARCGKCSLRTPNVYARSLKSSACALTYSRWLSMLCRSESGLLAENTRSENFRRCSWVGSKTPFNLSPYDAAESMMTYSLLTHKTRSIGQKNPHMSVRTTNPKGVDADSLNTRLGPRRWLYRDLEI